MPNFSLLYAGIEELDLSVRAYNFCRRNGVDTIGQFIALSVEDINAWECPPNGTVGLKTFELMREAQECAKYWIATS